MVNQETEANFTPLKVDPATYYRTGAMSNGQAGWLDRFIERKMVHFPAQQPFSPWSTYDRREGDSFLVTDPRRFRRVQQAFYDRFQLHAARILEVHFRGQFRGEGLRTLDGKWNRKAWDGFGKYFLARMNVAFVRDRLVRLAGFWPCYHAILSIRERATEEWILVARESYEANKGEELHPGQTATAFANDQAGMESPELQSDVTAALQKYKWTLNTVQEWRKEFAIWAVLAHEEIQSVESMDKDQIRLLSRVAPIYRYAYSCWAVTEVLAWVLRLNGEKPSPFSDLTSPPRGFRCEVCGRSFEPGRRTQKTCARALCQTAHKNLLKKEYRKLGLV
jgi:hypothetical protein